MKLVPVDHRPKRLREDIEPKCSVLYFPVLPPPPPRDTTTRRRHSPEEPLHIVWPHRWEHDKNPEVFFRALSRLKEEEKNDAKTPWFKVSVVGERFTQVPDVFSRAETEFADRIVRWGYLESKEDYWETLRSAHVVVSTALHEFFGVSVAEAVLCGCHPLVPNRLAYPELYPKECLYDGSEEQLFKNLSALCKDGDLLKDAAKTALMLPNLEEAKRKLRCIFEETVQM